MPDHQWMLTVMHEHNVTVADTASAGAHQAVPEPIPDWASAKREWKWGWYVHIYGLGVIYLLLALYAGISMLEFRRRLRIQQYILAINWILLILGLSRALFLFIDAYESTGKLPTPLTRVLYGIAFPCLTSSYSLIQLVFMRITKVNMGSSKLQNYRVLAAIITTHFTIVIVIDITVAYRTNLKWLLMLCQSFFITWGLILCFGFVYGGFKMTQFTTETQRVLKQLATYQRVKQETGKDGRKHELALHRIARPKLRILDDEPALSGMSDSSDDDSSNSLSFYNEAPLIFDDTTLANAYISQYDTAASKTRRSRSDSKSKAAGPAARRARYRDLTSMGEGESDSLPYISSESDYVTDTPSVARAEIQLNECLARARVNLDEPSPRDQPSPQPQRGTTIDPVINTRQQVNISNGFGKSTAIDRDHVHDKVCSEPLQNQSSSVAAFVNPTLDLKDDVHPIRDCVIMNGFVQNHRHESNRARDKAIDDIVQESGYMADTELNSPKQKKRFWKHRHKNHLQEDNEDQDCERGNNSNSSPKHEPYPLRQVEGTVSLYRIRQGRTLHKALKITYFTTLLGFICCILQLYAMFGVYGVLSNDQHVEAWPWYVYHLFLR